MRKNSHSITCGCKLRLVAVATVTIIASLALGKAEALLFQSGHLVPLYLCSLLHGFAPLIGVAILNGLLAHVFFWLVCSVDREFSRQDDALIPEPVKKYEWYHLHTSPTTFVTVYLSQMEHSPPAVSLLAFKLR